MSFWHQFERLNFGLTLTSEPMASRKIDDLHPVLAYAFGLALGQWRSLYPNAPQPFLICTYRSSQEQDGLYGQPTDKRDNDGDGRVDETDERVTNARGGQSPHNFTMALAFDVAFQTQTNPAKLDYSTKLFDQFAPLVLQTPGITWGGNFKSLVDRPHFELTDWKVLAKAK